ncbi:hypothetical protein B0H13DRAFT_1876385 [Mycena leptocephala]|nr:hypothetical protein B0H13DRAFT_1876385 [Mycena leptocephala]
MSDRKREISTCSAYRTKDSINSKRIFDIDFRLNKCSCFKATAEGEAAGDLIGVRKEVEMKIIGEYLNPLVEAADGNESDSLGLVQSRFNEAEATIGDTTTRAQMWGYKVKSGSGYSASSLGLGRGVGEDEDALWIGVE